MRTRKRALAHQGCKDSFRLRLLPMVGKQQRLCVATTDTVGIEFQCTPQMRLTFFALPIQQGHHSQTAMRFGKVTIQRVSAPVAGIGGQPLPIE